ncbi:hypothetical protein P0Y35_10670 [Kiritimatiellaeota bacterium B1221]|nr:hypothetical protein [Kiritimatiellaeota bacterium B1221]
MHNQALHTPSSKWPIKNWCIFALVMIGLLVLIQLILFISPIWDVKPVDDRMMWVTPEPIPEERNGRFEFEQAVKFLELPEANRVQAMLDDPEKYAEEIQGWVLHNWEFYELWNAGMKKGDYQPKWEISYSEEKIPLYRHGQNIAAVFLFQISQLPSQEDRIREYTRMRDLFQNIANREYSIHGCFGWAFGSNYFFNQLRSDFAGQPPGRDELRLLIKNLNGLPSIDTQQKVWLSINEYQTIRSVYQEAETHDNFDELLFYNSELNWWKQRQFFHQPNRTKAWYLEMVLHELQKLDPPQFPGAYRNKESIKEQEHFYAETDWENIYKSFNRIGKDFLESYSSGTMDLYKELQNSHQKSIEQLKTQAALHLYNLDHGEFPEALSELVPNILSAIPLDPFDGKNMKYLPEQKMIYSVGSDGKDDQGDLDDDNEIFINQWALPQ